MTYLATSKNNSPEINACVSLCIINIRDQLSAQINYNSPRCIWWKRKMREGGWYLLVSAVLKERMVANCPKRDGIDSDLTQTGCARIVATIISCDCSSGMNMTDLLTSYGIHTDGCRSQAKPVS